jgi:hypothetical protein
MIEFTLYAVAEQNRAIFGANKFVGCLGLLISSGRLDLLRSLTCERSVRRLKGKEKFVLGSNYGGEKAAATMVRRRTAIIRTTWT